MSIVFDRDARKSAANLRKHGVSFDEAKTVFNDENARLINDPDHSEAEDRFVIPGMSQLPRLPIVCHCYRSEGGIVRIISARRATRSEARFYL